MIEDNDNCPYSYHDDYPGTFLYPADIDKFVATTDVIASMDAMSKALLYGFILHARQR